MGRHEAACPGWAPCKALEGSPCSLLWTCAKLTLAVSGLCNTVPVSAWWVNEKSQDREGTKLGQEATGLDGVGATWPQRGLHSRTVVVSSSELESSEPVGHPDPESSLWITHWNECGFTHDHGPGSVLNVLHIFLHLGSTTIS